MKQPAVRDRLREEDVTGLRAPTRSSRQRVTRCETIPPGHRDRSHRFTDGIASLTCRTPAGSGNVTTSQAIANVEPLPGIGRSEHTIVYCFSDPGKSDGRRGGSQSASISRRCQPSCQ